MTDRSETDGTRAGRDVRLPGQETATWPSQGNLKERELRVTRIIIREAGETRETRMRRNSRGELRRTKNVRFDQRKAATGRPGGLEAGRNSSA